jgi:uncharacterized protein YndB with AHSA1/START domain
VTIDAQPEAVWPWVADLSKHAHWSPKPYRIEWLEGEPNAVGSRFHSAGVIPGDKHHENEGRITENQPTTRFAFRSSDPQGEYAHAYTLSPNGGGTDATHRIEFVKMRGRRSRSPRSSRCRGSRRAASGWRSSSARSRARRSRAVQRRAIADQFCTTLRPNPRRKGRP